MNLTTLSRPVKPRATRRALIVASVPELTMRTSSTDGSASQMRRASSLSSSVGAPKLVPRSTCAWSRPTTSGWPQPRIMGPHDETRSTNSLPSASQTWARRAREMNSGYGMPTPFMARTGEFTPPGMWRCASANRRFDVSVFRLPSPAHARCASAVLASALSHFSLSCDYRYMILSRADRTRCPGARKDSDEPKRARPPV